MVEPTHLKNISQIGSFPQVGVKIKNVWNHHLVWQTDVDPGIVLVNLRDVAKTMLVFASKATLGDFWHISRNVKKINSKSLFKPSKKMKQLCNGTNGVIKWNPWPLLIFWWNVQIAWMCFRCLEKVLINKSPKMVVSWWWISDGAIGSKNEKKTIQDCLVGGVNPFEENLSTWIVSLDNSEHSKNIFIWNHIETTTYKMGHYYSCKWNGVMGSLYMAENKWLSGALTKKWRKKKHQSINPRLLIPIASMYGIFTYIWLIFMVNVGKYTLHGWYGICEAWLVGSYHVAKVIHLWRSPFPTISLRVTDSFTGALTRWWNFPSFTSLVKKTSAQTEWYFTFT